MKSGLAAEITVNLMISCHFTAKLSGCYSLLQLQVGGSYGAR